MTLHIRRGPDSKAYMCGEDPESIQSRGWTCSGSWDPTWEMCADCVDMEALADLACTDLGEKV